MASLNFKGKSAVWNHHLSVPFHTLDEDKKLSLKGDNADENLIIEGDNLLALKALLPKYQGKVKCIYIDPPYNTGEEGWVYSDSVSSPLLKEWMGQVVDKDDLSRHDKWLCMMTPRMKLLRDLLSDEGLIFVSIDENEMHNLRSLMDSIFGEENFRNLIVIRRGVKSVQAQFETVDRLQFGVEYLLMYSKNPKYRFKRFDIELDNPKGGGWNNHWRGSDRPTMRYSLFGLPKPTSGQYRWSETRSLEAIKNYVNLVKEIGKPVGDITQDDVDAWYRKHIEETGEELDLLRLSNSGKPEHYISPSETKLGSSHWADLKPNGSSQLKALFGVKIFDTPKSVDLIKRVITLAEGEDKNTLVLDSFAGSGTTAQAVLELNSEDGGHRSCVLVQLPETINEKAEAYKAGYRNVQEITRQRVVKTIKKNKLKAGFSYYKLGPAIDAETMLTGELPTYENFAKYVYYLATGADHPDVKAINPKTYLVGKTERESIYLVYEQDMEKLKSLAIILKWAQDTQTKDKGKKIVYAPACYLDEESLDQFNIQFVSIPYNLFERNDL